MAEVSPDYPLGRTFLTVIHGDCPTGADLFAGDWCADRWHDAAPYPADWADLSHPDAVIRVRGDGTRYDAKAGPRRNARMLSDGRPELFLAYPRASGRYGPGTADMMRRLKTARVPQFIRPTDGLIKLAA